MTLSTEIAAARPEEQREVLERLWERIHGKRPARNRGGSNPENRFTAMLDCGAFLSAAEMLVPENWSEWQVGRQPWKGDKAICYVLARSIRREPLVVYASTPALALAAAIAKSLEEG